MSAYGYPYDDETVRENLRRHHLGAAILGVLVENRQVSRFMDGDSVNRLADHCIDNPDEAAIAAALSTDFDAGFGIYDLAEWFPGRDAGAFAKRIVETVAAFDAAAVTR